VASKFAWSNEVKKKDFTKGAELKGYTEKKKLVEGRGGKVRYVGEKERKKLGK